MKIYYHPENSDWIIDRIGREFKEHSSHDVSLNLTHENLFNFDLIWLGSSYSWKMITPDSGLLSKFYSSTPVLCTIHHIVPWKWNNESYNDFINRDKFVDMYHVYNQETADIVNELSKKPVAVIPHWVNPSIWFSIEKEQCKDFLNIEKESFVVGSFQRDTEGSDLKSPKLEKGPDIFVEICRQIKKEKPNMQVLLGGNRRQYVIKELDNIGIPYKYFENADIKTVNKMYSACDLYVVSSRCEGGPQSIFESSITKTNIISTNVGQAEKILDSECIYSIDIHTGDIEYKIPEKKSIMTNYENILKYDIKRHIKNYDNLMRSVVEGKDK